VSIMAFALSGLNDSNSAVIASFADVLSTFMSTNGNDGEVAVRQKRGQCSPSHMRKYDVA
jgi:hypothetical protein